MYKELIKVSSSIKINESFFETLINDLLYYRKSFKEKYCDLFYKNHIDLLLLLVNKGNIKGYIITNKYLVINTKSRVVIIGYDQESKLLFVNTLNDYIPNRKLSSEDVERILLLYTDSVYSDSYVVTYNDKWKALRVQGDLVVVIDDIYDSFSDMLNMYVHRLLWSDSFRDSVTRYVCLKIQQHLLKHRIHSVIRHYSVIINRVLNPYTESYRVKSEILKQIIINILQELPDTIKQQIYTVYIDRLREHYYASIVIDIKPNETSELYYKIENILEKELSNKTTELNINIGNHEIYVDKALPLIIRVNYDNSEFTLTTQRIFVPANAVMIIKHNEHRTKEIVFKANCELTVRTTNSAFDQDLLFNFVTFKNLINEYIKKNNIDLRKFFS